jgi:MFS family permease
MDVQKKHVIKLWNIQFLSLFIISLLTSFCFNMIGPILPKYAVSMGASLTIAGTISGIFAGTALLVRPFSGLIADRLNKKYLLAAANAIIALIMVGFSLSHTIHLLMFFRFIQGATFGISSTVNVALASTLLPKERMGEGLSLFSLSNILALAAAPGVGLFISDSVGYSYTFLLCALFAAIAFVLTVLFKYSPDIPVGGELKSFGILLKNLIAVEGLLYSTLIFCFSMVSGVISTFIVLYGEDLGVTRIGVYFTVNASAIIVSRFFLGKIIDRVDLKYIIFPSMLMGIAALASLASAKSLGLILLAAVLYALVQGSGITALQSASIRQVEPERRGVATSTYFIGADIGQGLGPIIGGSLSQHYGYKPMFWFYTVPLAFGLLLFGLHQKREKRKSFDIISF